MSSIYIRLYFILQLMAFYYCIDVIIPLYSEPNISDPNNAWSKIAQASENSGKVNFYAIVKPDSTGGPGLSGTQPNENYQAGVQHLKANSVFVLGHTYTSFGQRDPNDIMDDINTYNGWKETYRVNGIFLDEASNNPSYYNYHRELYLNIKKLAGCHGKTISNQGAQTPAIFYGDNRTADVFVIFEGSFESWQTYVPNSESQNTDIVSSYDQAVFIHSCNSTENMITAIGLATERNVQYVYVTDLTPINPYDKLTSYWDDEVAFLEE